MQSVVFTVGNEEYGIVVDHVDEIIRYTHPTSLPKTDPSVLGIINLRDRVIPIVSFRQRFGMAQVEVTNNTRIIIGELYDQNVGFVVDSVSEVLDIDQDVIEAYDGQNLVVNEAFISGIAKLQDRLVILLDLEKVMGNVRDFA